MSLRRISDPVTREKKLSVCSVPDAKVQARITTNDEDGLIMDYIETAFDYLSGPEGWLNGYCLQEESFEMILGPSLPVSFELPVRPFLSLTSFEVLGEDDAYTAVDTGVYKLDEAEPFAAIIRRPYKTWPYLGCEPDAYRIRFKAGHIKASLVPSPLRQSIRMLVGYWLNNRETVGKVDGEIEYGLKALARHYWIAKDHS